MMFLSIGDDNDDTVMYEMPVYMVYVVKKCSISNQPNQLTRMCRAVKVRLILSRRQLEYADLYIWMYSAKYI